MCSCLCALSSSSSERSAEQQRNTLKTERSSLQNKFMDYNRKRQMSVLAGAEFEFAFEMPF